MLKANKVLALQGYSVIDDKNVVSYNETFYLDEKRQTSTTYIMDQELYDANRKEMRKDAAEFQVMKEELEDRLAEENHD